MGFSPAATIAAPTAWTSGWLPPRLMAKPLRPHQLDFAPQIVEVGARGSVPRLSEAREIGLEIIGLHFGDDGFSGAGPVHRRAAAHRIEHAHRLDPVQALDEDHAAPLAHVQVDGLLGRPSQVLHHRHGDAAQPAVRIHRPAPHHQGAHRQTPQGTAVVGGLDPPRLAQGHQRAMDSGLGEIHAAAPARSPPPADGPQSPPSPAEPPKPAAWPPSTHSRRPYLRPASRTSELGSPRPCARGSTWRGTQSRRCPGTRSGSRTTP